MQELQNRVQNILYKVLNIKKEEIKLLLYSTLLVFLIFASYAILRPLRDSLGLENKQEILKWLFLATFLATLLSSTLAMVLSSHIKRKNYINGIYIFFLSNLLIFFLALQIIDRQSTEFIWLSRIFYVWVSVFNLFVISSAWSLLGDIFSKNSSKRLFGIISAGASLGGILGSLIVSALAHHITLYNFVLLSCLLLFFTLILKHFLLKEALKLSQDKEHFVSRFNQPIGSRNPFAGFYLIFRSPYLLAFMGFIFLLTSINTFLYMEQARITKEVFSTTESRAQAFAIIELLVQTSSFLIQIFLTGKIAKTLGVTKLLSLLGFVMCGGFIILIFTHPLFLPIAIIMSIRRIGEYALIKPGREMLFVPLSSDSKYKVKNFFDTVVYRGGDAISSQIEGALASISISLALFSASIISIVWAILGGYLGRGYDKNPENNQI